MDLSRSDPYGHATSNKMRARARSFGQTTVSTDDSERSRVWSRLAWAGAALRRERAMATAADSTAAPAPTTSQARRPRPGTMPRVGNDWNGRTGLHRPPRTSPRPAQPLSFRTTWNAHNSARKKSCGLSESSAQTARGRNLAGTDRCVGVGGALRAATGHWVKVGPKAPREPG